MTQLNNLNAESQLIDIPLWAEEPDPEFESLVERLEECKRQIVDQLTAIERLELREIPRLEFENELLFGCWNYQVTLAYAHQEHARLEYERASDNAAHGRPLDYEQMGLFPLSEADRTRQQIICSERARAEQILHEGNIMIRLSEQEERELDELLAVLVERTHPSLYPFDPVAREQFESAREAYAMGYAEGLRELKIETGLYVAMRHSFGDIPFESADQLAVELEIEEAFLTLLHRHVETLEQAPLYSERKLLDDPEWVRRKVQGLQKEAAAYRAQGEVWEELLDELGEQYA